MLKGSVADAAPQDGDTPLHAAAYNGHMEVVRVLLDAGVDKEAKNQVREGAEVLAISWYTSNNQYAGDRNRSCCIVNSTVVEFRFLVLYNGKWWGGRG